MPKFITIGYGNREGYDRTAKSVRDAAHAHDEVLQKGGALMGIAGLPLQVRNHEAEGVQTEDGPYMDSQLPVAGFAVIDTMHFGNGVLRQCRLAVVGHQESFVGQTYRAG